MSTDTGIIEIHGKEYHTVAKRLSEFWVKHPEWSITTEILGAAELIQIRATIMDETARVRATGTAEEERGSTSINKTSALENAETSAIGRALGVLGQGGTAIASAEEMEQALEQQEDLKVSEKLIKHNAAVREHIETIVAVKAHLYALEYSSAYEAFAELDADTLYSLRLAPTKGGIFTTAEIAKMKSSDWTEARHAHYGIDMEEK
jgi:hypothetical protein